jgi:ADP-ribose pyrophosphatase YjhB (NUDIX family)
MEKVRIIITARAVIIKEGKLLLVQNQDNTLWFTPGGWLEGFENLEDTCKREVYEELGIKIKIQKFLQVDYFKLKAEHNIKWKENINKVEHYFLCEIVEGVVESDSENRNLWQDKDTGNTSRVKFFTKEELLTVNFTPKWITNFL